jgi:hypothetical protein
MKNTIIATPDGIAFTDGETARTYRKDMSREARLQLAMNLINSTMQPEEHVSSAAVAVLENCGKVS